MPAPRRSRAARQRVIALTALFVVVAALGGAGYYAWTRMQQTSAAAAVAPPPVDGQAAIVTRPDGAEVLINGTLRGVTPLNLTLPVGTYNLELRNGTSTRTLPLVIESGSSVRQYVDLAPGGTNTGRLQVTSEPAGAQVTVDGEPHGVTPLVLEDVEPGEHRVTVSSGGTVVNRTVQVAAGGTATVLASVAPTGAAGGWVTVQAPFEVQIFEGGALLGTSRLDRLMLPAGKHSLELVSAPFEFQTVLDVQVTPGKTVTLDAPVPSGTLSVSALPWAEVWIDGQPKGPTPLGNLSVPIGNHDVIWRHPQLGERRQTVKVTAVSPVRVGMDMNK